MAFQDDKQIPSTQIACAVALMACDMLLPFQMTFFSRKKSIRTAESNSRGGRKMNLRSRIISSGRGKQWTSKGDKMLLTQKHPVGLSPATAPQRWTRCQGCSNLPVPHTYAHGYMVIRWLALAHVFGLWLSLTLHRSIGRKGSPILEVQHMPL